MTFWDFWSRHPVIGCIFLMCSSTVGMWMFADIGPGLHAIAKALREKDGR